MPPSSSDYHRPGIGRDAVSRLTDALNRHGMIAPGDHILVGVSGGADSVALLHLLHQIAGPWRLTLAVAHVDHGLRSDGAVSARFVADMAHDLGLSCHSMQRDVAAYGRTRGLSVETAGRIVRYAFFSDLCIRYGYVRVAVGHQRDDCAEQVLMNLARGAGTRGLAGIAPVRDAWVIRPLIHFSRCDILTYLSWAGLSHIEDPTNTDRRMIRNRIRHDILPVMAKHLNPDVVAALSRTADIISAENDWMDRMAGDRMAVATLACSQASITLSLPLISDCPLALQRRLVRLAIARIKGNLQRITHSHIDAVVALAGRRGGSGRLHLPERILVARNYDRLSLRRSRTALRQRRTAVPAAAAPSYSIRVNAPETGTSRPKQVSIEAIGAAMTVYAQPAAAERPGHSAGHCVAFFDMEKLSFPLLLRSVAPGDRIQPLGMKGSQKVFKVLKDAKIAPDCRAVTPVLVSDGVIVWVPGVKMGQAAAVSSDTRHVIRAEYILPYPKK